jgi:hypothetical protein
MMASLRTFARNVGLGAKDEHTDHSTPLSAQHVPLTPEQRTAIAAICAICHKEGHRWGACMGKYGLLARSYPYLNVLSTSAALATPANTRARNASAAKSSSTKMIPGHTRRPRQLSTRSFSPLKNLNSNSTLPFRKSLCRQNPPVLSPTPKPPTPWEVDRVSCRTTQ